jgi:ferredoxin
MLIMIAFLFCRTKLNSRKCTGCAACELSCPTGTLESNDEASRRVFNYDIYQCICCGACVGTCPEQAAELRHEISAKPFVKGFSKQEIRSVELEACERCGAFFSPEPQMDKIRLTFADDYTKFCPNCRKKNIGDLFHQLSPWTARPPNSPE